MRSNIIETIKFRKQDIKLLFLRQNGDAGIPAFHVKSDDNLHRFSISFEAGKFKVYNVKSSDSSNLYHDEMTKAIEAISGKLI